MHLCISANFNSSKIFNFKILNEIYCIQFLVFDNKNDTSSIYLSFGGKCYISCTYIIVNVFKIKIKNCVFKWESGRRSEKEKHVIKMVALIWFSILEQRNTGDAFCTTGAKSLNILRKHMVMDRNSFAFSNYDVEFCC